MNIQIIVPIVIAVLAVVVIGLIITLIVMRVRSRRLKSKFGPEYDYTLEKSGDRRTAEAELNERQKRLTRLEIHSLSDAERDRYHREWIDIQAGFVDDPAGAVDRANRIITEVMIARGFPVADFEQRSADLSVNYPNSVPGYREATSITMKSHDGAASTEELRQALVKFHSLFDELVEIVHNQEKVVETAS
jgi:hypothetical protein